MARISSCTLESRPASRLIALIVSVAAIVALFSACGPDRDRGEAPALYLNPDSGLQGEYVSISLGAQDVRLDECDFYQNGARATLLTFEKNEKASELVTTDVLVTDKTADDLRAHVYVAQAAEVGEYTAIFRCNSTTTFEGVFTVRKLGEDATLTLEPSALSAGERNATLHLSRSAGTFLEDVSHIIFGDGSQVEVIEEHFDKEDDSWVRVNIQEDAPAGESIDVSVVTGDDVVRGQLTILERETPSIDAYPSSVTRPTDDNDVAHSQYTVLIVGEDIDLSPPDTDDTDDTGVEVSFPNDNEEYGITVVEPVPNYLSGAACEIDNVQYDYCVSVTVMLFPLTPVGDRLLQVKARGQTASTVFNVKLPEGSSSLEFFPQQIPVGSYEAPVWVKGINFDFTNLEKVEFDEEWITVDYLLYSDRLFLSITTNAQAEIGPVTLRVTADGKTVAGSLDIVESEERFLTPTDSGTLIQAQGSFVRLVLSGEGGFSSAITSEDVAISPRSGLKIEDAFSSGNLLSLFIQVAPDAPVGPSLVWVNIGDQLVKVVLHVEPSGEVPWIEFSPRWISWDQQDVEMEFVLHGADTDSNGFTRFTDEKGMSPVRFDNPAIHIDSLSFEDERNVKAITKISPAAGSSQMTTVYLNTATGQAAATFQVFEKRNTIVSVNQSTISRNSPSTEHLIVTLPDDAGFVWNPQTVAQAMDGIGVDISAIAVEENDPKILSFDVDLEFTGPGGWTGISLTSDNNWVVAPIYIDGDNDSLTMELSIVLPAGMTSVTPGSREILIEARLPVESTLVESPSGVYSGKKNAYLRDFKILPSDAGHPMAQMTLDASFDIEPDNTGLLVQVRTLAGAAVGYVPLQGIITTSVTHALPWEGVLGTEVNNLFDSSADTIPFLVNSSPDRPGYSNLSMELLSENKLDLSQCSVDGAIWVMGDTQASIVAAGDTTGTSSVAVWPLSPNAAILGEETILVQDPCLEPYFGFGSLMDAFDEERILLSAQSTCRLTAIVIARDVADRPWSIADTKLQLLRYGNGVVQEISAVPGSQDPRMYWDPLADTDIDESVVVASDLCSTGNYLINIRQPIVIAQLSRALGEKYIALEVEPNSNLDDLSVYLLDENQIELASRSLNGIAAPSDGILVIGAPGVADVQLNDVVADLPASSAFTVILDKAGMAIDVVRIGNSIGLFEEGLPVSDNGEFVFTRLAGIDSNNNDLDFMPGWVTSLIQ